MRDLAELNINEGGRPVSRPAPSAKLIAEFERVFSVKFPDDHLVLLNHANGGHPELDAFFVEAGDATYAWAVNQFHHLSEERASEDGGSTGGLWRNMRVWRPVLGDDALPFASTGGGDEFFLDLARSPSPVKVCIHDENYRIVELAPSLAAFIDQLIIDPDYI